jgi:hypothetical protein
MMPRSAILVATLAAVAAGVSGCAQPAATTPQAATATTMQPGQRMQLGRMMDQRVVREVMITQDGGGLVVVYDMPPGAPQSQRVVRLENVNGMLEVVYDTQMPSSMALASGGTPRLVPSGGGMYSVEYGPPPAAPAAAAQRGATGRAAR